jgi:hypothetical protein
MSAKSRKRNKRLLALAGLAGAVALSNRKKKSDLAGTEDNKSGSTKITGGTNLNDYDGGTTKPIAKPDTTPKDTNKGSGSNVRTRQRIVDSSGNTVESAGVKSKDVKGILPPSQNKGNMYAGVGDTNPRSRGYGKKDGGRAEYKSGGKVKGCGKALRGFGKAMKGNR